MICLRFVVVFITQLYGVYIQVIDYIQQKAEMYELQAAVRNWERKVEIAEMAAKHAKQTRRQVKVNSTTNGRTGPQRSKRL